MIRPTAAASALLALTVAVGSSQPPKRLSLDRLYSLPWIIGKEPRGFAWAPDSRRVAFLWNDDGGNFADVWITDVESARPTRVTTMPRRELAPRDTGFARLEAAIAAETDPGVTTVTWDPTGTFVILTFRGDFYAARLGQATSQLTATPDAESRAAFAGNGALAYLMGGRLLVADRATAVSLASRVLVSPMTGGAVESFRWSPNGDFLAFVEVDRSGTVPRIIPDYLTPETSTRPLGRPYPGEPAEQRRLGVIAAGGGAVRWLDLGPERQDLIFGYTWSPDGTRLLIDKSDLFVKDRRILVADPVRGTNRTLWREQDSLNVSAEWWADWAPDGRGIFFVSDRDEDYHVYHLSEQGGEPRRLTRGPWAVFRAEVSSSNALVLVTNQGRGEERQVYRLPLGGGEPIRITRRAGTYTPTISPDGRYAALYFSSDSAPPDLYLSRLDGTGEERRVTVSPRPDFGEYRWVMPRYVTFPQRRDGVTLHGRLILPPDFDPGKRYPAIVGSVYSNTVRNQWGGRTAHPTWGLDQYLAQEGYVLLNVDLSGSSGRGKTFRQRIRLDYGGIDVEDLHSGVDYLKSLGWVDGDRIGIWGSSYGGLLTTMSLFTKPGVYKAGIAGAPATNVWHALTGEMRVMMRPQDQWDRYAAASSHTKAAGLRDHLMIIHGMRDRIVLFKDSVTLLELLMREGRDVDFVMLPNSEHGWDLEGLYQTRFAFKKMVDFFNRHLKGQ